MALPRERFQIAARPVRSMTDELVAIHNIYVIYDPFVKVLCIRLQWRLLKRVELRPPSRNLIKMCRNYEIAARGPQ